MKLLNELIGNGLLVLGLHINNRWVASIQFFCLCVIKITVLLCFLIYFISYIQSYFPPERQQENSRWFSWHPGKYCCGTLGNSNTFCSCSSIPLFIGFTSAGLPLGVLSLPYFITNG
jgi:uncharacterized membrane protein YraQ (UPF0718 family)